MSTKLTRRDLLLSGASVAALATIASDSHAAMGSAASGKRFAVSVQPSKGHRVPRQIFGADLEAFARVIYGGVWDRERNIPRADVKAAIAALGTSAIRWPGSSSASAYHWRDGIGPQDKRPFHEKTFWSGYGAALVDSFQLTGAEREQVLQTIAPSEPNQFGAHEFLQYCIDLGIEPVLSVNLGGPAGEGTPDEAAAWVRYCNVERRAPRPVQWWQLGNESWSKLDRDHQPPRGYGRRLVEVARAMRREDPSIKLICVATAVHPEDFASATAATFPDLATWNREVFAAAAPHVSAASFTWYFPGSLGRVLRETEADATQMATAADLFGLELDRVIADLDAAGARDVKLYVGEWGRQVKFPEILISDTQRLYDGLFFAGCFNRMIERAQRMAGANLSMLVNTIGPIQTVGDRHYVTAAYLVSQLYRWTCRGEQAPVAVTSDRMHVRPFEDSEKGTYIVATSRGERRAPILDAAATSDRSGTTVYLTNRGMTESATVAVSGLRPMKGSALFRYVTADSPYSFNTVDAPHRLRIAQTPVIVKEGRADVTIPSCTTGALIVGPIAGALAAS